MKMKFILSILLLLPLSAWAGNGSGNVSNVVQYCAAAANLVQGGATPIFGVSSSDPTKYKTLVSTASGSGGVTSAYFNFHDMSAMSSGAYSVTGGKHFYGQCLCFSSAETSSGVYNAVFQTGETTGTFTNGGTTITGGTTYYQTGATGNIGWTFNQIPTGTVNPNNLTCQVQPFVFDGTYTPFVQNPSSTSSGMLLYQTGDVLYAVGVEQ
jgi:hypothetical protein